MSNAIVVPDTFKGGVAAVFQGQQAGDDLSGGITGGYGLLKYRGKVWSIQHHGNTMNLMRDDGDGPRGSVDVVIVKANSQLSKTWYEGGWDENSNNPPDCASANGIVPDQGVPKPQAAACLGCAKNAWGSAPGGGKGKACGDHRRMAIVPITDLRNESFGGPLLLRCPAASLQDMAAFDARYKGMGYPYFTMAVKIGFDPQESFPKFTFSAIRPLSDAEGRVILELRNSPETARVVNEGSAAAPAQIAQQPGPAFLEPTPATPMVQPQQVSPQPVAAQPAPVAQPAPAPAPAASPVVVAPASNGAGVGVQPNGGGVSAGGFGPTAAPAQAKPQPTAQPVGNVPAGAGGFGPASAPATDRPAVQAGAAKPPVTMTGFGAAAPVTPAGSPAGNGAEPAKAQPVAAEAPATPQVATAFEGSIDDRLDALLKS